MFIQGMPLTAQLEAYFLSNPGIPLLALGGVCMALAAFTASRRSQKKAGQILFCYAALACTLFALGMLWLGLELGDPTRFINVYQVRKQTETKQKHTDHPAFEILRSGTYYICIGDDGISRTYWTRTGQGNGTAELVTRFQKPRRSPNGRFYMRVTRTLQRTTATLLYKGRKYPYDSGWVQSFDSTGTPYSPTGTIRTID